MTLVATELANAMANQLAQAWRQVKGPNVPFPADNPEDARIIFLAVARGLLSYMEAHQNDMVNSIRISGGSAQTVNAVDLDIAPLPEF